MTEVWWCAVTNMLDDYSCRVHYQAGIREPVHESCGPIRLVPVDALVLVRDAEGNWPIPVIAALSAARVRGMRRDTTPSQAFSDALDALVEAVKENPQW